MRFNKTRIENEAARGLDVQSNRKLTEITRKRKNKEREWTKRENEHSINKMRWSYTEANYEEREVKNSNINPKKIQQI